MSSATVTSKGEIALPVDLLQRHGLGSNSRVRLVETKQGILLVPLTDEPMSPELAQELAEWQTLGATSWERFPYSPGGG
jgi:bifunctional DNA-binding transcriptional regulator/antitoxin component of YhaV-PrlF toxin-antitoxin module